MSPSGQNIAPRYVQRRVLLFSLLLLSILFIVTAALARMYHMREEGLVEYWHRRGDADLANGNAGKAFEDYRNALSYDPDNSEVQLRLAEALLVGGHAAEARSYLANLWERSPGSGRVNLDIARDSAQMGDDDLAIRYFRAAVLGSWEGDPSRKRRDVRLELCEYLIAHGRLNDAQAEIAGLAADTPAEDGILHEEIGHLFLKAGQPGRALAEFEAALQTNSRQSQWLADAGHAAFDAGDYSKAKIYYSKADRENPSLEVFSSLTLVQDVLGNDPFLEGLSDEEQTQRTRRDIRQAVQRLRQCLATRNSGSATTQAPANLQLLEMEALDLEKPANLRSLAKSREARDQAMQLVFRIENSSSRACGSASGLDQALVLIGKRDNGISP